MCKTFGDVLESQFPTLHEAQADDPKDLMRTRQYVCAAIIDYLDFKNRRNTMSSQQIAETATLIIEDFGYLHLDDLRLFIRRLKTNTYGEVYDLDGQVFIGWLRKYVDEKRTAEYKYYRKQEQLALERSMAVCDKFLKTEEGKAAAEKGKKIIDDIIQRFDVNKKIEQVSLKPREVRRNPNKEKMVYIRQEVIRKNQARVMREHPDNWYDIMKGMIDAELEKYGLKQ